MNRGRFLLRSGLALICAAQVCRAAYPAAPQILDRSSPGAISLRLTDWTTVPKSGTTAAVQVARINFVRQEPEPALASQRLFANDLNGNLYLVNRSTGSYSTYLNFPSIFNSAATGQFDADPGFAAGLVTFAFDPDYANNGKFYTVHTELTTNGSAYRRATLTEWQDTNINDNVFTGTHAALIHVDYTNNIHPMGDLTFNPTATPASADWRNLYISSGDGGAGESAVPTRNSDQMLNNFLGKILRITPSATGTAGTYSIPADNPYVSSPTGASKEIYADGLRNPHRLSWDVDPATHTARLFVTDIGLHSYEEVDLVKPGANYGYSRIEGNQVLSPTTNNVTNDALPSTLPIYVSSTTTSFGNIVPTYPLAMYSHQDGDAIAGGFVYRGTLMPELRGKFVFGDITTGRLFYADESEMLSADDGNPATLANVHELNVFYDDPADASPTQQRRVFDLIRDRWDLRNELAAGSTSFTGTDDNDPLPGVATVTAGNDAYGVPYGGGRADIRFALIDNELYLLSKSDGMARAISSAMGDANLDGSCNFDDVLLLAQNYGLASGATWATGDFDQSGGVNFDDLLILAQHYGLSAPPAIGMAAFADLLAPEPGILLFSGMLGAIVLKRTARPRGFN